MAPKPATLNNAHRAARLAELGRTHSEIATALHLTPKTVENLLAIARKYPPPVTRPPAFPDTSRAACRDQDTEVFLSDAKHLQDEAKTICATCPVRAACLTYALHWQLYGIWGGTTQRQRRNLQTELHITPQPVHRMSA